MSLVSLTLPSDGQTATAASVNGPFNALANAINGNLDSTNISSLAGTKIQSGTLPGTALNAAALQGWNSVGQTFTYTGNNGNKEFTGTFPADLSGVLSPGMKMSFTRSTSAPTQSMAFTAASSQYATKASPSGITFTSAFTCEAWVYLNSYPSSAASIIGRDSAAASGSGWEMQLGTSGQVYIYWRNASGASVFNTYQSLPLKRWVHVATTATAATPTAAFYINGTLVPSVSTATAATSIVQASANLQIAKGNNSTGYMDAYLSEVRVWSAAQSQASIQANMAISLLGSETNLVALFQGNGNFNDKTTNANNLTATGGAIATQAANPYNNIEYAEIVSAVYSSPNTTVTLNTGDYCNIPNLTLNSPQYSTAYQPYGAPEDITGCSVRRYVAVASNFITAIQSAQQIPGLSITLNVPANCKRLKITMSGGSGISNTIASSSNFFEIWDGTPGTGTRLAYNQVVVAINNGLIPSTVTAIVPVTPGSKTYNGSFFVTANTGTVQASKDGMIYLSVEPQP
jgi:hypothetical protein